MGKYRHVAVLMGGWSAEREVSLSSGKPCADALEGAGYRVTRVDAGRDLGHVLTALKPDVCFNALHGRWGEDGCVQGLLEVLGIPYTHSGVLASALAMHKVRAKTVMREAGIPVVDGIMVRRADALAGHPLEPPYVIKPYNEGSSVGVIIVRPGSNKRPEAILPKDKSPDELVLAERYIHGRELTCAVIDGAPTDIIDIIAAANLEFYDYEAKYAPGGSRHVLPARITPKIYQYIQELTLKAHQALGCRGVSRADFRYDDRPNGTGEVVCLEVNTQPGMTGTSLVPEMAAHRGLGFGELVSWIVEDASLNR
ncbi:MAG: D-alanine--D-alanine ligase [Hyphomicrobiaceae bacterium]|nr:MAG: D-alanine--D-alanine ligase [Hyphomicrobiaceae bacterium]